MNRSTLSVEAAVFLSGVVSMGLEMVAGRMLAPEFGSSVYTWGSIIGVFMAALALGYHFGGRRSSSASRSSISRVFLLASLYVAALIVAGDQVLTLSKSLPLGPRYLSLLPASVLFGPPAFLLGFVSPYAAELSALERKGEASGRVYALGTAGSILGTFAATFALIPLLSVQHVLALLAAASILTSIIVSLDSAELYSELGIAALAVMLLAGAVFASSPGLTGATYATQTPYQQLEIRDSSGVRTLYLNGQPQSAAYLNGSSAYPWRYPSYFHMPFLMADEPSSIDEVLFIGAGGFSGPKRFAEEYDVSIDVVEIDPEVVDAGRRYFNASSIQGMDVHVQDGRVFLQQTENEYDLIVMDAYRKASVPFHLTTREFLELAESRLSDDGFMYANLISAPTGPDSRFFRAEYRTMETVFPEVYAFRTSDSPLTQNIELVAPKEELGLGREELVSRSRERDVGVNLEEESANLMEPPETSDVPVLRDDRAPVSRLTDPLLGTKYVIEGSNRYGTR